MSAPIRFTLEHESRINAAQPFRQRLCRQKREEKNNNNALLKQNIISSARMRKFLSSSIDYEATDVELKTMMNEMLQCQPAPIINAKQNDDAMHICDPAIQDITNTTTLIVTTYNSLVILGAVKCS